MINFKLNYTIFLGGKKMKLKRLVSSFVAVFFIFCFSTVHAFSDVESLQPESTKTIVQDLL